MLVKNKKHSTAKISIQWKVAQYYFFCVWYANILYKAICIYDKSLANSIAVKNLLPAIISLKNKAVLS